MNWKVSPTLAGLCLFLALFGLAHAATPATNALTQARALEAKGDSQAALKVLDSYLGQTPHDAAAQFERGLVLVHLKRTDDAIQAFSKLTKEYPKLPEPYNNLAVLYASRGEYDKARNELKTALATHPSYATASENLGDVYAAMAGQAYNRALKIEKSNKQIRYKLSLIKKLNSYSAGQQIVSQAPVAKAKVTSPKPSASVKPVAVASQSTPAESTHRQKHSAVGKAAVKTAVYAWADAWSRQDIPAYLSHYSKHFSPPHGLSRAAWVKQRKERLSAPKYINVSVSDLHVTTLGDDKVSARFKQKYHSNIFSGTSTKTLVMEASKGQWRILQEIDH